VTLDSPTHAKRTLDLFNGVTVPFRPSLRLTMQASTKLSWAASLLREGQPTCPNMSKYVRPNASLTEVSAFVRDNVVGCVSWDDLRLIRRAWPGHPILKGIMSSQDALFARDIGADGVFVSNHGGRQLEASAASVDVLPAIADALAGRVSLLMDGGCSFRLRCRQSACAGSRCCIRRPGFSNRGGGAGRSRRPIHDRHACPGT
jgi:(S)-mandelate dehydrogenase